MHVQAHQEDIFLQNIHKCKIYDLVFATYLQDKHLLPVGWGDPKGAVDRDLFRFSKEVEKWIRCHEENLFWDFSSTKENFKTSFEVIIVFKELVGVKVFDSVATS